MRIAILHDTPTATDETGGDATQIEAAHVALQDLGHTPIRIGAAAPLGEWTERILDADVDLVLNLCVHGDLPRITATAELLGLRLTGSGSETLFLTQRRDRVSAVLRAAGLPVATWSPLRDAGSSPLRERLPLRVEAAMRGADASNPWRFLVEDAEALDALIDTSKVSRLVVQEAGAGHYFTIGIVGGHVLPIAEREPPVRAGSEAERAPRFPSRRLLDAATELAVEAWRAVEGIGYGKVDVQAAAQTDIAVLDVRANPTLSPGSALTRMAAANGWGFTDLVARILDEAANR